MHAALFRAVGAAFAKFDAAAKVAGIAILSTMLHTGGLHAPEAAYAPLVRVDLLRQPHDILVACSGPAWYLHAVAGWSLPLIPMHVHVIVLCVSVQSLLESHRWFRLGQVTFRLAIVCSVVAGSSRRGRGNHNG